MNPVTQRAALKADKAVQARKWAYHAGNGGYQTRSDVMTTNPPPYWRFVEFNPRRAMRGAEAARVEVDPAGEWLWMSKRDIKLNIRDHGDHPELQRALAAYGAFK